MSSAQIWFPKDKEPKGKKSKGYLLPSISSEFLYSHDFGLWMALCSRTSYENEEDGKRMFVEAGFEEDVCFVQKGDTQAYVAVHKKGTSPFAVIVFRGTENLSDLITDMKLFKKPISWLHGCRVHHGFHDALDVVWCDIIKALQNVREKHGTIPLHLTGHSLGGALALLASLRLKKLERPMPAISVVTIGCPRVGNGKLSKQISKSASIHRVVHASDMVPRVPLLLLGYRHAGTEHWLLADGNEMTIDPDNLKLSQRLRWLNLVYNQPYHFIQYLLISLIVAMLLTKGIYTTLHIELSIGVALLLVTVLLTALMSTVTFLILPYLPIPMQRWFRPHILTDHKSDYYVDELAKRTGTKLVPRETTH